MLKRTLCFSNKAHLSLRHNQLVIKRAEPYSGKAEELMRPIEDIGVIIIESEQVTLTSALIASLLTSNAALIFCDEKHMPSGLLLPLEGNTLQEERFSNQIGASVPLKKQLWQQTVSMKIRNQGAVLRIVRNIETGNFQKWAQSVRSGDPDNLEGRAAAYYWRNIFGDNSGFRRDRDQDDVNQLLNYGYAILRAIIARSLVGSGLLPTLGIHHSNKYNAYCLADDIMEPYRPYVDMLVIDMVVNRKLPHKLTAETKRELLTIPTLDVKINNLSRPLLVAASFTTASLAKCFSGESRKISYPEIIAPD